MPERSTVAQGVQLRVESVYGTDPGTGTKKLAALSIDLDPAAEFNDPFTPMGNKYPTLSPIGKEWASAELEGRGTYTEIIYPLGSVVDDGSVSTTITVIDGFTVNRVGVTSREWVFNSATSAADTPKSFTVEQGDASFGELVTGLLVNSLSLAFSRDGVELSGDAIARLISTGVTLAASPTSIALIPILGKQVSVYMDSTAAALGTTKLLRAFEATLDIGGRYEPVWALDAAQTSFAATVENRPDTGFELVLEADSVGNGLLTAMRADTAKFLRVQAFGDTIETVTDALKYAFRLDVCARVVDAPSYDDRDGVKVIVWPMALFHDPTWNKSFEIRVVNTLIAY